MPRPRPTKPPIKQQPFSLIFKPEELSVLRRIASTEGVAIATIIRKAIHTIIARTDSELIKHMIEGEVETFLDQLSQKFPTAKLTRTKRRAFKNRLVKELV